MADPSSISTKNEKLGWTEVNIQLRRCGLEDVRVLSDSEVALESGQYVCLDLDSSKTLRYNILSLVRDSQHTDGLIQHLIEANVCLREDVARLKEKAEKCQGQLDDMETMLQCCRDKIQFHKNVQQRVPPLRSASYGSRLARKQQADSPRVMDESSIHVAGNISDTFGQDTTDLQKLRDALNQLLGNLLPRARIHLTSDHTVKDMADIIDDLADEETTRVYQGGREHVARATLEGILEHFQMLFDVPCVSGILPRMNELYRHLGEEKNVLNTLRDLLGLAEANSSSVVDAVGRLCQMHNSTTSQQLQQLFETDDLSSVIRHLGQHKQFFTPFRMIMNKLLEILGVERMDQVIPAVRALKLLSD